MKIEISNCFGVDNLSFELKEGLNNFSARYNFQPVNQTITLLREIGFGRITGYNRISKEGASRFFIEDLGYNLIIDDGQVISEEGPEFYWDISFDDMTRVPIVFSKERKDFFKAFEKVDPEGLEFTDLSFPNWLLESCGFDETLKTHRIMSNGLDISCGGTGFRKILELSKVLEYLQKNPGIYEIVELGTSLHELVRRRLCEIIKELGLKGYIINYEYDKI